MWKIGDIKGVDFERSEQLEKEKKNHHLKLKPNRTKQKNHHNPISLPWSHLQHVTNDSNSDFFKLQPLALLSLICMLSLHLSWPWLTFLYSLINKLDLKCTELFFFFLKAITNCSALRVAWLVFSWLLYQWFVNTMENGAHVFDLSFFFFFLSKSKLSTLYFFTQSAQPLIQDGDIWWMTLHIAVWRRETGMYDMSSSPSVFLCEGIITSGFS